MDGNYTTFYYFLALPLLLTHAALSPRVISPFPSSIVSSKSSWNERLERATVWHGWDWGNSQKQLSEPPFCRHQSQSRQAFAHDPVNVDVGYGLRNMLDTLIRLLLFQVWANLAGPVKCTAARCKFVISRMIIPRNSRRDNYMR